MLIRTVKFLEEKNKKNRTARINISQFKVMVEIMKA